MEQTQAEFERLRLQYQKRIDAAYQLLWKQELELIQLLQQLNQSDTGIQYDNNTSRITNLIPTASK